MRKTEKSSSTLLILLLIASITFLPAGRISHVSGVEVPSGPNVVGKITVYPDGRVELSGTITQTLPSSNETMHVKVEVNKTGNVFHVSNVDSFTLPPESLSSFPIDAMHMNSSQQYSNGTYMSASYVSLTLKSQFASQYPFNVTDLSVGGMCSNGNFNGTVNVIPAPGFALGRVAVGFDGNQTHLRIFGNMTVYYGSFMGMELNATNVEDMLDYLRVSIPGKGASSLYNTTKGFFECVSMNVPEKVEQAAPPGAFVQFDTTIVSCNGTFFESLMDLLMSSTGIATPIMSMPGTDPPGSTVDTSMISLIAGVWSLIGPCYLIVETATEATFQIAYSHLTNQMSIGATSKVDHDRLANKTIYMLGKMLSMATIPPNMKMLQPQLEYMMRQKLVNLTTMTSRLDYASGVISMNLTQSIEGDLDGAISYVKNMFLSFLAYQQPWTGQFDFLNQTSISVAGLKLNFDLASGQLSGQLENLVIRLPIDNETGTSFQLKRAFNMTYGMFPPTPPSYSSLTIVVEGGSNTTHYTTIYRPATAPLPSTTSANNRSMTWNNPTISNLQDLTFIVNPEPGTLGFSITDPSTLNQTHPMKCDASQLAATEISINQISCPAVIIVKNMSTLPSLEAIPTGNYKFIGKYVNVSSDQYVAAVNATIRMYYTEAELQVAGVDEASLAIFHWNETTNQWEKMETRVNTARKYVEADTSHFSIWAVMGAPPTPIWMQTWFIAAAAGAIIVILLAAILAMQRSKKKTHPPQQQQT